MKSSPFAFTDGPYRDFPALIESGLSLEDAIVKILTGADIQAVHETLTTEKTCLRCHTVKPEDDFCIDRSRPDGRHPYCAECRRDVHANWFKAHHDKRVAQINTWRAENVAATRASDAAAKARLYATDPEFRETIRQRNAENYRRRKAAAKGAAS
jgi:hypothetical protein